MAIEKTSKYWKGSNLFDLYEALEDGCHSFQKLYHPVCDCGSKLFRLACDVERTHVRSTCPNCGSVKQLPESPELWRDVSVEDIICPCGNDLYQVGVGVTLEDGKINEWAVIGQRCHACGILGRTVCRDIINRETDGNTGSFLDLQSAHEILKGYPLQLYEVIYWSGAEPNGEDAIYLVAAKDHIEALDIAGRNPTHKNLRGNPPQADSIQEIGIGLLAGHYPRILRGPYYTYAYESSLRSWKRDENNVWVERQLGTIIAGYFMIRLGRFRRTRASDNIAHNPISELPPDHFR